MPITVKMQHLFNGMFANNHKMGLLGNESKILVGRGEGEEAIVSNTQNRGFKSFLTK